MVPGDYDLYIPEGLWDALDSGCQVKLKLDREHPFITKRSTSDGVIVEYTYDGSEYVLWSVTRGLENRWSLWTVGASDQPGDLVRYVHIKEAEMMQDD